MNIRELVPRRRRALWTDTYRDDNPLFALRRDMNRTFDTFFNEIEWDWPHRADGTISPAIDMVDKDDTLVVTTELPGVAADDVEITLDKNVLMITGEKKMEADTERNGYSYTERRFGAFNRAVSLPKGVDPDSVEAKFEDGILTVTFKRLPEEAAEVKKIALS